MSRFIWDPAKESANIQKHGVDFMTASRTFLDPKRKIFIDERHSLEEERYFCVGKIDSRILTVRFVYRNQRIRILGAGYWRKGKSTYEKKEGR